MNNVRHTIVLLLFIALMGCASGEARKLGEIEFVFTNSSAHDLDWVRLDWEGPSVSAGIMKSGANATRLDTPWPDISKAKLTFVDDQTRQRYNIDVSFTEANAQIRAHKCHRITLRILGYDKAGVVCE